MQRQSLLGHHPGSYPMLKKQRSYRAVPVLARALSSSDEGPEFTRLVRRLAALLALAPALDTAYAASARASSAPGGRGRVSKWAGKPRRIWANRPPAYGSVSST